MEISVPGDDNSRIRIKFSCRDLDTKKIILIQWMEIIDDQILFVTAFFANHLHQNNLSSDNEIENKQKIFLFVSLKQMTSSH